MYSVITSFGFSMISIKNHQNSFLQKWESLMIELLDDLYITFSDDEDDCVIIGDLQTIIDIDSKSLSTLTLNFGPCQNYEAANIKEVDAISNRNCYSWFYQTVLNNADKLSRRRPSDSASNTAEKFPMKKNHDVPNNPHCRNSLNAQADQIIDAILPELISDSDLKKMRSFP
ncbi:hypothetical protein ACTFIT_003245 [Dictyostelium discoideum]